MHATNRTSRRREDRAGPRYVHSLTFLPLLAAAFLFAFAPSRSLAHPVLTEQLARITLQLEKDPRNAGLWLRRAEVSRRSRKFERALADLDQAERLRPSWNAVALERARAFFDWDRPEQALAVLEKFLKTQPDLADSSRQLVPPERCDGRSCATAEALVLRARCSARLGRAEEALRDYSAALARPAYSTPDLFLERARLQAALGRLRDALAGLDEGMQRLGLAPGLELLAIEYERQQGNFDAALSRLEAMMKRSPAKERALLLQAEVLEQAGHWAEAKMAFSQALSGINRYPVHRRGVPATLQLERQARDGLARLAAKPARPPGNTRAPNPI